MHISVSTDWAPISADIAEKLHSAKLSNNRDLIRLHANITTMVCELSRLEVVARQKKTPNLVAHKVDEINSAIDHLEQLIFFATLSFS